MISKWFQSGGDVITYVTITGAAVVVVVKMVVVVAVA